MLRPADRATLDGLGLRYSVQPEGEFAAIVIEGFDTHTGLAPRQTDLLILLPPGFPDASPDMFWTTPFVTVAGAPIGGTDQTGLYVGRTWQRWSRHIGTQWRPGIDNLGTYLAYIRRCFSQAAEQAA